MPTENNLPKSQFFLGDGPSYLFLGPCDKVQLIMSNWKIY